MNLEVVQPLTARLLSGQKLGLDGEHQYVNAGLAVSLASIWLQQIGKLEVPSRTQMVKCSFPSLRLLTVCILALLSFVNFIPFSTFFFELEYSA